MVEQGEVISRVARSTCCLAVGSAASVACYALGPCANCLLRMVLGGRVDTVALGGGNAILGIKHQLRRLRHRLMEPGVRGRRGGKNGRGAAGMDTALSLATRESGAYNSTTRSSIGKVTKTSGSDSRDPVPLPVIKLSVEDVEDTYENHSAGEHCGTRRYWRPRAKGKDLRLCYFGLSYSIHVVASVS